MGSLPRNNILMPVLSALFDVQITGLSDAMA